MEREHSSQQCDSKGEESIDSDLIDSSRVQTSTPIEREKSGSSEEVKIPSSENGSLHSETCFHGDIEVPEVIERPSSGIENGSERNIKTIMQNNPLEDKKLSASCINERSGIDCDDSFQSMLSFDESSISAPRGVAAIANDKIQDESDNGSFQLSSDTNSSEDKKVPASDANQEDDQTDRRKIKVSQMEDQDDADFLLKVVESRATLASLPVNVDSFKEDNSNNNNLMWEVDRSADGNGWLGTDIDKSSAWTRMLGTTPGAYAISGPNITEEELQEQYISVEQHNRRESVADSVMVEATLVMDDAVSSPWNSCSASTLEHGLHELDENDQNSQQSNATPSRDPPILTDSVLIAHAKSVTPCCTPKRIVIWLLLTLGMAIAIPLVTIYVSKTNHEDAAPGEGNGPVKPMLERIKEAGVLRCNILDYNVGANKYNETEMSAFAPVCRAIAAAIFGRGKGKVALVVSPLQLRYKLIATGEVDVLLSYLVHTMDRDIYIDDGVLSDGLTFSSPLVYHTTSFAGNPEFIKCAENNFQVAGNCSDLALCAYGNTRIFDMLQVLVPKGKLIAIEGGPHSLAKAFLNQRCNVMVTPDINDAVMILKNMGYPDYIEAGNSIFHPEPVGIVTRNDDPEFSDFCEWIIQAILTIPNKSTLIQTDVFGDERSNMFNDIIAEMGGHWPEYYDKYVNPESLPQSGLNSLNNGTTGLIRSMPLGITTKVGPDPINEGTMSAIIDRGKLCCAVRTANRPGFAARNHSADTEYMRYHGIDVDYCRAVAAGILGSAQSIVHVEWVEAQDNEEAFRLLHEGSVDIIAGIMANLERDVREPTTGTGFTFTNPYFHNNIGIYNDQAKRYEGETADLNLCLATRQDDVQWSKYVYWIVESTFFAEEKNISFESSNQMPLVDLFGEALARMFRDAILAVGNYGDVYRRNLQIHIPREGRNLINLSSNPGPQLYALPGLLDP